MNEIIDRETPLPLYFQLGNIIKNEIASGALKPGDTIPTENELMDIYSISRATVRHAISNLVNDGYLRRERAKGTYVNYPPSERKFLGNLKCFSEEMMRKGIPHSTQLLEKRIIKPDPYIIEKLQLLPGKEVFYLKRLRTVDESPVLIVGSYIPYELCVGLENEDFNKVSLYDVLENKFGLRLHHGHRVIEPKLVDSEETMRLLNIEPGTCISLIESTICASDNRPIEFLQAEMLGKISIDLG